MPAQYAYSLIYGYDSHVLHTLYKRPPHPAAYITKHLKGAPDLETVCL